MICKCPAAAALPDVPTAACPESFGQIQKVVFQRLRGVSNKPNEFKTADADITKLASWTKLVTAVDGTKIVVSPYIEAPTAEGGAPRTFGGGNDTLGGIETIIGREPTAFTGVIRNAPQNVIKALKEMQCESQGDNLGIFLIDEHGAIGAISPDGAAEGTYRPIPIRSFFVGDKTLGGLDAPDSNAIQWAFMPNWSDNLKLIAVEFNPLTDIVAG